MITAVTMAVEKTQKLQCRVDKLEKENATLNQKVAELEEEQEEE